MEKPLVFAHRGASGYEYENTIPAFDKAIELGADGLETDAWLLADGEVILHHDKGVLMKDNVPVNISKLTLEEIKNHTLPNGEKTPTLREFLDIFSERKANNGKKLQFSIDLMELKVGQAILDVLKDYNVEDQVILCASTAIGLKKVRKKNTAIRLVASNLYEHIIPEKLNAEGKYGKMNLFGFNTQANCYTPELASTLKQFKLKNYIWDLHDEESLRTYLKYKPDAIYSNYPDLAVKIRDELFGNFRVK